MTMVGGFDVHRQQITFDYVDDDGLVHWGQIRPATRKTLRSWLAEHCPDGDGEFGLEGCTGWRYVTEELAAADVGVHLGDPAEIAALRGPKKRAKTDRADARLLRTLLLEGRFPESWVPLAHVLEVRTLGRLYCTLMDERRSWQSSASTRSYSIRAAHRFGRCYPKRVARRSGVPSCRWQAAST
jgi:transposase